MLLGRRPAIALKQQILRKSDDVRLQRPNHDRPQHLDHDALLSATDQKSIDQLTGLCRPRQHKPAATQGIQHQHRHNQQIGIMELMPTSA
jgi:hypothetical protein